MFGLFSYGFPKVSLLPSGNGPSAGGGGTLVFGLFSYGFPKVSPPSQWE